MTVPNNSNVYLPGTIQIPSSLTITAITNAYPAVATVQVNSVSESNIFMPGMCVLMNIPYSYKMFQMDRQIVKILTVNGNSISLDIDSRQFDPFVVPSNNQIPAMMAPAGSRNLQYNNTTNQVPFQSLNNQGN